ncbi:neprilysin-1-like isoform X2 [Cylas formicarius]|uniref:neprilysin-1-like isoform X2 n=1 Tax=Cylas formicarius TaxID=197179 RepID=UPI002958B6EE|nr:neprilysin-1-like isoform X2 [Cylas formicarius]
MTEVVGTDKHWKCTETNNGYLKPKVEESLLGNNAVNTVVQMSGGGTMTTVTPRVKPAKEKCLLALVLALIIFSVVLLLMLVSTKQETYKEPRLRVCLTEECVRTASSLLSAMDHTADPCVDFFQYACGTWNKKHIIPEDRSSISTFEVMADQLQVILKGVLEEPISLEDNDATRKAKTFYNTCMDIFQIRRNGDTPIREVLDHLGGWPVTKPDWRPPDFSIEVLLGRVRGIYNEGFLIEQWIGPDDKNSSVNIIQMDQMSLALPSRDYYLKSSSEGDMKAYHTYMSNIAVLLGANKTTVSDELQRIIDFERKLANASLPEQDRHDTSVIYRKLKLKELQTIVPQINWLEYFRSFLDVDIDDDEPVVAYGLAYFVEMGKILAQTERRIVHDYVLWRLVMSLSAHMIGEYQRERVEFRKILQGVLSERHRWSQCVEWTNKKLGMAVGALFIRDNFNHDSKETALQMIHTIREAFNELLAENDWMDDETRAVAKEKADAMNERIGYPKLITDREELTKEYAALNVTSKDFMKNILNILKFDAWQNLKKLRQPVDKDKWSTEPAVVNAFYNPNKNDIGRQFDKDGNMMQWWNNATIRAFRERAQCIIDQYSRYKIDEVDLYVNGRMTQGENIADNGGLKQSFRAYRKWVARYGEEDGLPGLNLTHDQLFFLNYAQIWCGSMRPEDALTKVRSSVHSPGPIRVLGPLSNSRDFAKAYKCTTGSPMNPTNKCSVW